MLKGKTTYIIDKGISDEEGGTSTRYRGALELPLLEYI